MFDHRRDAEKALEELKTSGLRKEDLGLITRVDEAGGMNAPQFTSREHEGAVGGIIGGILGNVSSKSVGGIGPIVAAGTLGAMLRGAGASDITSALEGIGIYDDDARYCQDQIRAGRTIVTVLGGSEADEAAEILDRHGAMIRPPQVRRSSIMGEERRDYEEPQALTPEDLVIVEDEETYVEEDQETYVEKESPVQKSSVFERGAPKEPGMKESVTNERGTVIPYKKLKRHGDISVQRHEHHKRAA